MNRISRAKRFSPIAAFWLFLVVAGIVVLVVYLVNERGAAGQYAETKREWSLIGRAVSAEDHVIGDPAALVEVIVYSSISCSNCRIFFERDLPRLQAAFGDALVIAYRHNPIPELPNAQIQEEASECVYRQGGNEAFWRFVRALFPHARSAGATDVGYLANVAAQAGVSAEAFTACIAAGGGAERVRVDAQEAAVGGLNIDPSFLLKSPNRAIVVKGNYYSQIYAGIEYLLNAEGEIADRP